MLQLNFKNQNILMRNSLWIWNLKVLRKLSMMALSSIRYRFLNIIHCRKWNYTFTIKSIVLSSFKPWASLCNQMTFIANSLSSRGGALWVSHPSMLEQWLAWSWAGIQRCHEVVTTIVLSRPEDIDHFLAVFQCSSLYNLSVPFLVIPWALGKEYNIEVLI